jgi:hypothetical protein
LIDYAVPEQHARWNFLLEWCAPPGTTLITTNPTYKQAGLFVTHALALRPMAIMLLRTLFLKSQNRRELLRRHALVCTSSATESPICIAMAGTAPALIRACRWHGSCSSATAARDLLGSTGFSQGSTGRNLAASAAWVCWAGMDGSLETGTSLGLLGRWHRG